VTVITDHSNARVLDVLEFRDKDKLVAYLRQAKSSGVLAEVEEVTSDMWSGFLWAVQEVFGEKAKITIDRFHVIKLLQERLTEDRRAIQKGLDKEQKKELKGSRWLWLKNEENLSEKQKKELEKLKEKYPRLAELSAQRDALREVFEDRTIRDAKQGVERLREWVAKARAMARKGLEQFCQTLENHLEMIANYFVNRASNGRVEGFNHGLRSILWRAFGMVSFTRFRLRVLDRFGRPAKR
jgi:transposase